MLMLPIVSIVKNGGEMSGLRISDYTYKKTMEHYPFLRGKSTMAINHRSGLRMVLNLMGRFFEFSNKF